MKPAKVDAFRVLKCHGCLDCIWSRSHVALIGLQNLVIRYQSEASKPKQIIPNFTFFPHLLLDSVM